MPAPVAPPSVSPFPLTRAALRADRFRAAGAALALAALALALWGAWALDARLALRAPVPVRSGTAARASAPATASPAELTLRAAGLARRGR